MKRGTTNNHVIRLLVLIQLLIGFTCTAGAQTCHLGDGSVLSNGCCSASRTDAADRECIPCIKATSVTPVVKSTLRLPRHATGHAPGEQKLRYLPARSAFVATGSEYAAPLQRIAMLDNLRTIVLRH